MCWIRLVTALGFDAGNSRKVLYPNNSCYEGEACRASSWLILPSTCQMILYIYILDCDCGSWYRRIPPLHAPRPWRFTPSGARGEFVELSTIVDCLSLKTSMASDSGSGWHEARVRMVQWWTTWTRVRSLNHCTTLHSPDLAPHVSHCDKFTGH